MPTKSVSWKVLALPLVVAVFGHIPIASAGDYKLGFQDRLRVRVYEWRQSLGELQDWSSLNGDFTINENGKVILPLIGEVPALGLSAIQLADSVSERLRNRLVLLDAPSVIVDIAEYRPIFISGDVERPGEYPFRLGMTIQQAVSVAGGMKTFGSPSSWQPMKDLINFKAELSSLNQNLQSLKTLQIRLEAEFEGRDTLLEGPDATSNETMSDVLKEQQKMFNARLDSMKQRILALESKKELFTHEIDVLNERIAVSAKQQELTSNNLKRTKGYLTNAQTLQLEANIANLESAQLDFKTRIVKAQQDVADVEKQLLDMQLQRKDEALVSFQENNSKIDEIQGRIETVKRLIIEAEGAGTTNAVALANGTTGDTVSFTIQRAKKVLNGSQTADLQIEPGDLVTITRTSSIEIGSTTVRSQYAGESVNIVGVR